MKDWGVKNTVQYWENVLLESRLENSPLMGKVCNLQLNRQREPGEEPGDWQSLLVARPGRALPPPPVPGFSVFSVVQMNWELEKSLCLETLTYWWAYLGLELSNRKYQLLLEDPTSGRWIPQQWHLPLWSPRCQLHSVAKRRWDSVKDKPTRMPRWWMFRTNWKG